MVRTEYHDARQGLLLKIGRRHTEVRLKQVPRVSARSGNLSPILISTKDLFFTLASWSRIFTSTSLI